MGTFNTDVERNYQTLCKMWYGDKPVTAEMASIARTAAEGQAKIEAMMIDANQRREARLTQLDNDIKEKRTDAFERYQAML